MHKSHDSLSQMEILRYLVHGTPTKFTFLLLVYCGSLNNSSQANVTTYQVTWTIESHLFSDKANQISYFRNIKIQLVARLRGQKQRIVNVMLIIFHFIVIRFYCFCPLSLAIKLNFDSLKVAYWVEG